MRGSRREPADRVKGRPPPGGVGGGRGVQFRGVELNRVAGSGGVEPTDITVAAYPTAVIT